tara:strand:- start:234 stop:359 length:126 start_codon:yes stop_codon:yes gene_type:complete
MLSSHKKFRDFADNFVKKLIFWSIVGPLSALTVLAIIGAFI